MNKTKIEWCDYAINLVKGLCPMACDYCYARRMYKRYKWNPEITFDAAVWNDVAKIKKPSRVFVGSTMELFGEWVKREWMEYIFKLVKFYPKHTFIFLTKQPQNLAKWSPFPENCWVGVSVTNCIQYANALTGLGQIKATVKFISFEPLLERIFADNWGSDIPRLTLQLTGINWLIIGQQTPVSKKTEPKLGWIKEIVEAAEKAKIPVFLKDNLNSLFAANNCKGFKEYRDKFFTFEDFEKDGTRWHLRQEFPK